MGSDTGRCSPGLVFCVKGPTASGKTELAIELAREFPLDIVSVDSALVYRRMNIGTAKPGEDLMRAHPHALIDIREPWQTYSAGQFCADAKQKIMSSWAAGRVPLLIGGTMLYFDSLVHGLASLPASDSAIRDQIDTEAKQSGWAVLHGQLADVDPVAADRIGRTDAQRIQRALEVYRITGTPISELQKARTRSLAADFVEIALIPQDRQNLARRIESRFDEMLARGFVDEVASLLREPEIDASVPAMRAVGYRQLIDHVAGNSDLGIARERALAATRQLGKRQLTWLRGQTHQLTTDPADRGAAAQVRHCIRDALAHRANAQRTG